MPATSERIPEKGLSGTELKKIILRDVAKVLDGDGMLSNNISYARIAFDVRVTLHLDLPTYPKHVSQTMSRKAAKQHVAADPAMGSIEAPPLTGPLTDEEVIRSTELRRQIESSNMARVENELPLTVMAKDPATGGPIEKEVKFVGDLPDPATVGNKVEIGDVTDEQAAAFGRAPKRRKGKGTP